MTQCANIDANATTNTHVGNIDTCIDANATANTPSRAAPESYRADVPSGDVRDPSLHACDRGVHGGSPRRAEQRVLPHHGLVAGCMLVCLHRAALRLHVLQAARRQHVHARRQGGERRV